MTEPKATVWHAATWEEAAARLGVETRKGLSGERAAALLEEVGPNIITPHAQHSWMVRLLAQFHAPLVYILIVAGLITIFLAEYLDAAVIFGVVLVNAAIGFVQESKALAAIDSLSRSMKMEANVRRGGRRVRIDAAELVPGDVVLLEGGDRIPADLRLTVCNDLHADESMLTGESLAVSKHSDALEESTVLADRRNMAFAGALVTRGTGEGVVVLTGDDTEVGRISAMISAADQLATPLTQKIAAFSHMLLKLILAISALAFVVGLLRGKSAEEMFMASVALAVGAIPEGLPAAVTIMLAVGVSRMAARRAIIRKLPAVETLGSTTVICSDKTGTLTQNQMTVTGVWTAAGIAEVTGTGYDPQGEIQRDGGGLKDDAALRETLLCGALCNDAALVEREGGEPQERWKIQGDPTEAALLVSARKAGMTQDELTNSHPRVDIIPFESEHQFMATMHTREGARVVYVKGSTERLSGMCSHMLAADGERAAFDAEAVKKATAELSGRGLRVLAFAKREVEGAGEDLTHEMVGSGLTFLGLQGMLDPPRPEAIDAVTKCRGAGVKVKMITGDHALTAATIAGMIGIGTKKEGQEDRPAAISGAELAEVTDEDLPGVAESTDVFARMTPEQKLRLVKALQGTGNVVAMTGDGVNDAPALRQADIGIAMGITGTEVAKDAADMVLADDNFASIEAAVEEGRCVYDNLTKFIVWTLPTNGGEAFFILA
jgi:cation-transporting ATPase F